MLDRTKKIVALIVFILVFIGIGFAWWHFSSKSINTKDTQYINENIEDANLGKENLKNKVDITQASDGLILIHGGKFLMGSPESETQREEDETQHEVTVNDFYISRYELTQKEYEEIMGDNPSHFKGDTLPVENITWYDAIEFCNQLSIREGFNPVYNINDKEVRWDKSKNGYRLPTEAEWKYAARAGSTNPFSFKESIGADEVNFLTPTILQEPIKGH